MSMQRISLKDLARAPHPLLSLNGDFSLFHDTELIETVNINHMMDLDGVCLLSRYNHTVISNEKEFNLTFLFQISISF